MKRSSLMGLLFGVVFTAAVSHSALAAEVSGIKFADSAKVGGKELQLNGLGVRTKFTVKVYAASLYLEEKQASVDAVLKAEGPRRLQLVMMREITSEDLANAFMSGLSANVDETDKSKIVSQISKFGEHFGMVETFRKGDVIDVDWLPGAGTQCYLNGKKVGGLVPDLVFYNSVLRIWLGEKPVDPVLKTNLLATSGKN